MERYGQVIGREELSYEFSHWQSAAAGSQGCTDFSRVPAGDGRAGTRNYLAVVAASNCAAHTAEMIARSYEGETLPANVDGVMAFPHAEGCGHAFGPDVDQLRRALAGAGGVDVAIQWRNAGDDRSLPVGDRAISGPNVAGIECADSRVQTNWK